MATTIVEIGAMKTRAPCCLGAVVMGNTSMRMNSVFPYVTEFSLRITQLCCVAVSFNAVSIRNDALVITEFTQFA